MLLTERNVLPSPLPRRFVCPTSALHRPAPAEAGEERRNRFNRVPNNVDDWEELELGGGKLAEEGVLLGGEPSFERSLGSDVRDAVNPGNGALGPNSFVLHVNVVGHNFFSDEVSSRAAAPRD